MTRPCILDIETNKLGKINNCNLEKKDTLNSYIATFWNQNWLLTLTSDLTILSLRKRMQYLKHGS